MSCNAKIMKLNVIIILKAFDRHYNIYVYCFFFFAVLTAKR